MAGPYITFTAGGSRTITFDTIGAVLTKFVGGDEADRHVSVSVGGKPVTVINDVYWTFAVKIASVPFPVSATDSARADLANLHGWISHTKRGGQFTFAVDSSTYYTTTISANAAAAATSLTVNSTSGMTVGDWIHIEDTDDPTKWEKLVITNISGAVLTTPGLDWAYTTGSTIRYHEYFPACILADDGPILKEREAGQGANLWDLEFVFRTVR